MCVILEAPRDYVTMTVHLLICCCCCCVRRGTRSRWAGEDGFCSLLPPPPKKKNHAAVSRPSEYRRTRGTVGGIGGGGNRQCGAFRVPDYSRIVRARLSKRTRLNRRARRRIDNNIFIVLCPTVRTGLYIYIYIFFSFPETSVSAHNDRSIFSTDTY